MGLFDIEQIIQKNNKKILFKCKTLKLAEFILFNSLNCSIKLGYLVYMDEVLNTVLSI